MSEAIGVGIVGGGFGADVILPALLAESDFEVRAIAASGAGQSLDKPVVKASGVAVTSVDRLMVADDIAAVVVAVPSSVQAVLVEMALRNGKHVLCEKPFTMCLEQANKACGIASEARRVLAVDYQFRYDPLVDACVAAAAAERIGRVRAIKVRWWSGGALRDDRFWSWRDDAQRCGGVLTEWCSHVIDYLPRIGGSAFAEVACRLRTDVPSRLAADAHRQAVTTPDGCLLDGVLRGDVHVSADVSTAQSTEHGHCIRLVGERGTFVAEIVPPYGLAQLTCTTRVAGGTIKLCGKVDELGCDTRLHSERRLLKDYAARVRGSYSGKLPLCSDAKQVWVVMSAALESARTGGQRILLGAREFNGDVK